MQKLGRLYVLSFTSVCFWLALQLVLERVVSNYIPLTLFTGAVVFAALLSGAWAGVAATVLGFFAEMFFFMVPRYQFAVRNRVDVIRLVIFAVEGLALSFALGKIFRRAESAKEEKSNFLANMSHEIRTPLGAVIGFTELLSESDLSAEERARYVAALQKNGKYLCDIIDDTLDLAKVESGRLEFERDVFPLSQLIDHVDVTFAARARAKGIDFQIRLQDGVPEMIYSDPTRLRQILFNLLGNAIKFTSVGRVALHIAYLPRDAEGAIGTLEIIVEDTGIGLSANQREKLFNPFIQADASTSRKFGGSGLGLALSRRLARGLGGDIAVLASAPNCGSAFRATIHVEQCSGTCRQATAPCVTAKPIRHSVDLAGLRVLAIDDSPDNLMFEQKILQRAGAQVTCANGGREGLERALSENFDVVLMDMQMPELDGYEATLQLIARGFTKPIIALTANATNEDRIRCLALGCVEHLTKPINQQKLVTAVQQLTLPSSAHRIFTPTMDSTH